MLPEYFPGTDDNMLHNMINPIATFIIIVKLATV